MQPRDAMDDLKAIRRIMEQARRSSGGFGGWFMVLWGVIWLLGFAGTHFLWQVRRGDLVGWLWLPLDLAGVVGTLYFGVRMSRRARVRSSALWKLIVLWWLALAVFVLVLVWLLPVHEEKIPLLIILTIGLGYFLFGLFAHWSISAVGVFLAVVAIGAALLFPDWLYLAVAVLGGGALIGTGFAAIRYGAEG